MSVHDVSLADRFDLSKQSILLGGTQALVRAVLMQKARDEAAGLRTVAVVTGGTASRGYLDFRAVAPALVGDETDDPTRDAAHCAGLGVVRSTESCALQTLRAIQEQGIRGDAAALCLKAGSAVILRANPAGSSTRPPSARTA